MSGLPRVGIGVDVHAFAPEGRDRELWIAGLLWPGEPGLEGHSDADVAAHAACDALFSAAGIGDLGAHFGTDRPELAGAAGATLLGEAARLVRRWVVRSVDWSVRGRASFAVRRRSMRRGRSRRPRGGGRFVCSWPARRRVPSERFPKPLM